MLLATLFLRFDRLQRQPEIGGEFVGHVEPKRVRTTNETPDAGALNARFLFQRQERYLAGDDRFAEQVGYWQGGGVFHDAIIVP